MAEQAVIIKDLGVTFADGNGGLEVLRHIDISIPAQQFLCILGPSGSGKSTLLRVLAGLVRPTSGGVSFPQAQGNNGLPDVGLVFQQANLMPWRTVLQNISLPLELQGKPAAETSETARSLIELIGLQGFENTWPRDLSGGMAQRVAIARALAHDPDVLLLDEPFGSLDEMLREKMSEDMLRIWQASKKTVVMVTHSVPEAVYLSDRVLVFSPRPAEVTLDLPVNLPRPRRDEMRYSPQFLALTRELREASRIR